MDATALLIARLIVGLGLTAHGMQKLLGCFGGHGLKGTASMFESSVPSWAAVPPRRWIREVVVVC